jgi:hypothetical protein
LLTPEGRDALESRMRGAALCATHVKEILVEAGGIEPPSKTVGRSATTSVSPVLFLGGDLSRGRLAVRPA